MSRPPSSPPLSFPEKWDTLTVGMGLLWTRRDWLAGLVERRNLLRCVSVSVHGGFCCQTLYNLYLVAPTLANWRAPSPASDDCSPEWPSLLECKKNMLKKRSSLAYSSPVIDYSHKSRQFNALQNQPSERVKWCNQACEFKARITILSPHAPFRYFCLWFVFWCARKANETSSQRRSNKHLPFLSAGQNVFLGWSSKGCLTANNSILPQPSGFRPAAVSKSLAVRCAWARTDQRLSVARALVSQPSLLPPTPVSAMGIKITFHWAPAELPIPIATQEKTQIIV